MNDINELVIYLNQGFSLIESIEWVIKDTKLSIYNSLVSSLNKGLSLSLAIYPHLPSSIYFYLDALSKVVGFEDALVLTSKIVNEQKLNKNELIQALIYPLIMVVISISGLLLFNLFGFDQLMNFIGGFNIEMNSFYTYKLVIDMILYIIVFSLVIVSGAYLYIKYTNKTTLIFVLCNKYRFMKIFREYATYSFIQYYYYCTKFGLNTKDTLDVISLFNKPLLVFQSYHVKKLLLDGQSFEDSMNNCYLDTKLYKFIQMAKYSKDLDEFLEAYLKQTKQRFIRMNKRLVKVLQIISYSMIGLLLIIVYQIVLMPLEMIKGV